jgi:hypothetical protein
MKTPGRLWAERRARRRQIDVQPGWRQFASKIAWLALAVAIIIVIVVSLSR